MGENFVQFFFFSLLQIRWIRYGHDNDREVVKPGKGGGYRFITFTSEEDLKFHSLLNKAIDIYFINGINHFGEYSHDVEATILDSGEIEVNLMENIHQYMKDRGLFPSRTWFYLQTKPAPKFQEFSPVALSDSSFSDCDLESQERRICPNCSRTYTTSDCFLCQQDKEYQQSLETDAAKNSNHHSSLTSTQSSSLVTPDEVPLPSLNEIRQQRISALSPAVNRKTNQSQIE